MRARSYAYNMTNERARKLRKSIGDAERKLWHRLRSKQLDGTLRFRRQHPIGPYIADFVCLEKYLVIEVDGGHHGEPEQMAHDEKRSAWLSAQGYRVIRFWTHEVLYDTENVLSAIFEELKVQPSRERTTPTRCIQWLSSAS